MPGLFLDVMFSLHGFIFHPTVFPFQEGLSFVRWGCSLSLYGFCATLLDRSGASLVRSLDKVREAEQSLEDKTKERDYFFLGPGTRHKIR